jgi:hypothetical protein
MGQTGNYQFRKLILFVVSNFTLITTVWAGSNAGYAGSFLRMGLGAKALAMGNTGVAMPVNAYSTFYNPAALSALENRIFGLSYSFLSLDRQYSFISVALEIPPQGGVSISWIRTSVNELKSYNSVGQETGDINQSANAVYFSFGRPVIFDNLAIGVSIKILFEYINDGTSDFDYSSNGVGLDFGMQYRVQDNLTIAYQVRDINSKLKANTDKLFEFGGTTIDKFPVIHKFGVYYLTNFYGIRGVYEFERSDKGDTKHHFGIETVSGENLALRLGLNDGYPTFGAGLDFEVMKIKSFLDYAFLPSVIDEGSSHIFSWQFSF